MGLYLVERLHFRSNRGGLHKSTEKTGKAKHPIVQVGTEATELLEQFVEFAPKYKELDQLVGSHGSVKVQLAPHIKKTYFRRFAGGTPDSTMLCDVHGNLIKLVTKNRYSTKCTDLGALDEAGEQFRTAVLLKIDMEKIAAEKQQPLVDAIIAAAQQLEIPDGIASFTSPLATSGTNTASHLQSLKSFLHRSGCSRNHRSNSSMSA